MKTLQTNTPWLIKDMAGELSGKHKIGIVVLLMLALFLFIGTILQFVDPTAGVLDIGILSVWLFGLLVGMAAIFCSLWLQEILWQPFKAFRKEFNYHFNQLTSWQQCIIYFSVLFLSLFAVLWALSIIL
ncbi:hypothetical protein [Sphingobacterium sp. SGR-19]|uniref:hypothetical protein n=1 Tax=Sphingobacterium sp. SGR-19 TaxID=2710886 RepID=UPI0013E9C434|nr:hypothetical protein [Sphingobacterium sp. SGR-19]NGM64419.1 hypothetical protein [Sphingobacterium sp. SGR-19]